MIKEKKKRPKNWILPRKALKLTSKNSGSYECVFGVENEMRTFDAKVGDSIIVERFESTAENKKVYHEGTIEKLTDDGWVHWYDEVRDAWWLFNWKHKNIPLVIRKKQKKEKTI